MKKITMRSLCTVFGFINLNGHQMVYLRSKKLLQDNLQKSHNLLIRCKYTVPILKIVI